MHSTRATSIGALALATLLFGRDAAAQTHFGSSCAGASGFTPTLTVSGVVKSGQTWTLEVTYSGGVGIGYLAIGFSNTSASAFGGLPLPLDLGGFFADPLWSGCPLNVDPSHALVPYVFDPISNDGFETFTLPGFDVGTVYVQAIDVDPNFTTRIAGVSRGLAVRPAPPGMVAIVPGTFEMGSNAPSGAPYFGPVGPVHTVTISQPFWIGAHEVTQAEYEALMGVNPSQVVGPNRPVTDVNWFDAGIYCFALTVAQTLAGNVPVGYEYRLPTEAEWEYACRAGTTTEFNVGLVLNCTDARIGFSYHSNTSCGSGAPVDVGSYPPNAWDLFDMRGNVWEWCHDSFASYSAAPVTDPLVTGGSSRIIRGGGAGSFSSGCRSAVRGNNTFPNSGFPDLGFRVVLGPILVP